MKKSLEKMIDEKPTFLSSIANSRFGRFMAGACLAAFLYCSCGDTHHERQETEYSNPAPTPPAPCSDYNQYLGSPPTISPNPTNGATETTLETTIYSYSSPFAAAWALVDGTDKVPMQAVDGAFDSNREDVLGTITLAGYGKGFHKIEVISQNTEGCKNSNVGQYQYTLAVFNPNVLWPPQWTLQSALERGWFPFELYPDSHYLDFSWDGASASVEYDFSGGPVTFNIEAATATRNSPTEKAHMDVFIVNPNTGAAEYIGGADPEQGGAATYPVYSGSWFNYSFDASVPPGKTSIIIRYSGDTWDIDLYVRDVEVIEKTVEAVETWNKIYDSMYDDIPTSITTDAAGNIYVTGISRNFSDDNFWTLKLDEGGNIIWERKFDSGGGYDDQAMSIAVDSSGNVYVGGQTQDFGRIVKYDSNGNLSLIKYCPEFFKIEGIKVDNNGNMHATGWFQNIDNTIDNMTVKYDSNGNLIWSRTNDIGEAVDQLRDIALDANGNVYVTGNAAPWYRYNLRTIKHDKDGNTIWDKIFDNQGYPAIGKSIAVDDRGNVYIAVEMAGSGRIIKYSSNNGDVLGDKSYDAEYGISSQDLALDSSGNVYLTGYSMYFDTDYNWIWTTMKVDNNLNKIWQQTFSGAPGIDDRPFSIAVDSSGQVYALGWTENIRDRDFRIIKYRQVENIK